MIGNHNMDRGRRALTTGALALLAVPLIGHAAEAVKVIAITQIVEHPDLDRVRQGVLDALRAAGFDAPGYKIVYESAQGDIATAVQIARRFVGLDPAVVVAIGTPSAQAVVRATKTISIIFGGIGDPLGAGLVQDLQHPGGNVTGSGALTPVGPQLDILKQLLPVATQIGVLSNPAEANSRAAVDALVKAATQRGYTCRVQSVVSSSDTLTAASDLVGKVDLIYVPTDSTVVSSMDSVVKVELGSKLPVFTSESGGAARGALAAAGFDWYGIGQDTGAMVARVLWGEKPGDIPVKQATTIALRLNARTARALGITLPPTLLAQAAEVIE